MARQRLRRSLMPSIAAALLGPLIAIGVAWSLAAWMPPRGKVRRAVVQCPAPKLDSIRTTGRAALRASRGIGYEFGFVIIPAPRVDAVSGIASDVSPGELEASISPRLRNVVLPWITGQHWPYDRRLRAFMAFGWPMPALWTEYTSHMSPGKLDLHSGGIALPGRTVQFADGLSLPAALPLHPVALGIVVDAAVYAAGIVAVWMAVRGVRVVVLRNRGQCIVCRYDLHGLAPGANCPECGAAAATAAE